MLDPSRLFFAFVEQHGPGPLESILSIARNGPGEEVWYRDRLRGIARRNTEYPSPLAHFFFYDRRLALNDFIKLLFQICQKEMLIEPGVCKSRIQSVTLTLGRLSFCPCNQFHLSTLRQSLNDAAMCSYLVSAFGI